MLHQAYTHPLSLCPVAGIAWFVPYPLSWNFSHRPGNAGAGVAMAIVPLGMLTSQLIIASVCISVSINVLATSFIASTLLRQRRLVTRIHQEIVSSTPSLALYSSITAIFVESAALYTVMGLVFLPFLFTGSAYSDPVAVLFQMSVLFGPALIQLRVAKGKIRPAHSQVGFPGQGSTDGQRPQSFAAPNYPNTIEIKPASPVNHSNATPPAQDAVCECPFIAL
jgi:hypothetical protein